MNPTTPTHMRLSTAPRRRKLRRPPPTFTPAMPDRPAHLSAEAAAEWARVAPVLLADGLLCASDGDTLARYCEAWSTWQRATVTLDREGYVITSKSGRPHAHPLCRMKDRASSELFRLGDRLGMSPLARARLAKLRTV